MLGSRPRDRCFGSPVTVAACGRIALRGRDAAALARLLPLLGCGEEAAALAFDALADAAAEPAAATALQVIADEERGHDALIAGLIAGLPADPQADANRRAARRFHVDLGRGDAGVRLARIAATDAAVCTILSRLLAPGRPLGRDAVVATVLSRIHRDEARHVRLSRALAAGPSRRDVGAAAREALAAVLRLAAGAFETLGIDPDRLDRDLRRLPDGLYA